VTATLTLGEFRLSPLEDAVRGASPHRRARHRHLRVGAMSVIIVLAPLISPQRNSVNLLGGAAWLWLAIFRVTILHDSLGTAAILGTRL